MWYRFAAVTVAPFGPVMAVRTHMAGSRGRYPSDRNTCMIKIVETDHFRNA